MTAEKAIEILEDRYHHWKGSADPDFEDATLLGKEALKREQHRRQYDIHLPVELLPGETEE